MKRILLASFLAAVVTFAFGAAYWMNLTKHAFLRPKDDAKVQALLKENLSSPGSYIVPDIGQEQDEFHKKAETGPVAIMHLVPSSGPEDMGAMMGKGFVSQWLTMFVLALVVNSSLGALPSFGDRVRFCALVGLVGLLFIDGGNMIWWHHSEKFTLFAGTYHFFSFLLAGLVIAAIVRAEEEQSAITQASAPVSQNIQST